MRVGIGDDAVDLHRLGHDAAEVFPHAERDGLALARALLGKGDGEIVERALVAAIVGRDQPPELCRDAAADIERRRAHQRRDQPQRQVFDAIAQIVQQAWHWHWAVARGSERTCPRRPGVKALRAALRVKSRRVSARTGAHQARQRPRRVGPPRIDQAAQRRDVGQQMQPDAPQRLGGQKICEQRAVEEIDQSVRVEHVAGAGCW